MVDIQDVTPRKFEDDKLVIASHNLGKIKEFSLMLENHGLKIYSAKELNLPDIAEVGTTFKENAILKAKAGARFAGMAALADDSGLEVKALENRPGIYSARYAKRDDGERDFDWAMGKLLKELENEEDRSARFTCALALAWPCGHAEVVEGYVYGKIANSLKFKGGFGYDPIFVPESYDINFGEMSASAKAAISHRGEAMAKMIDKCFL